MNRETARKRIEDAATYERGHERYSPYSYIMALAILVLEILERLDRLQADEDADAELYTDEDRAKHRGF